MKETAKSLRAYFVIAGLLSAYSNVTSLLANPGVLTLAFDVAGILLALGFLYAGAVLPTLLASAPERLNLLLGLTAGVSLAHGAVVMLVAPSVFAVVVQVVSLLICFYLYVNVKRLAAEARALPVHAQ
jgi:hypothetical protein